MAKILFTLEDREDSKDGGEILAVNRDVVDNEPEDKMTQAKTCSVVFAFLLDHPEMISNIISVMKSMREAEIEAEEGDEETLKEIDEENKVLEEAEDIDIVTGGTD